MTNRLLALPLMIAAACGAGSAAPREPAARPDRAAAPVRGPFLWQVNGKGGPSYLFGTIHAGFHAERELPAWVWDKLSACDTFVMELDPTSVSPIEIARRGALPEDQSLDVLLGPEDWRALTASVQAPESSLRRLKPWVATLFVLQGLFPTPLPLDEALRQRALSQGKQLAFLEDWQLQAEILETTTIDDLREMLDPASHARRQLTEMVAAYRDGDFEKISALALDPQEIAKNPERHARLLDDRNRAWVGKLVPHLDRGRTFVAVGAGHFAGDQGLLALLRARGYTIERVVKP